MKPMQRIRTMLSRGRSASDIIKVIASTTSLSRARIRRKITRAKSQLRAAKKAA